MLEAYSVMMQYGRSWTKSPAQGRIHRKLGQLSPDLGQRTIFIQSPQQV